MMGDNSTRYETSFLLLSLLYNIPLFLRYLEEMTLLLREEFPYSTVYPVLGDQDFNPPSQAKPQGNMCTDFIKLERALSKMFYSLHPFSNFKTVQINEISNC